MGRFAGIICAVALTLTVGLAQAQFATVDPASATSVFSEIVPANTTSVAIKASPGKIYGVRVFSNSSSAPIIFGKFYNAAQGSTTCGTGTPQDRFGSGQLGSIPQIANGEYFSTAITLCVTGGIQDSDTTLPASNTYVLSVDYK